MQEKQDLKSEVSLKEDKAEQRYFEGEPQKSSLETLQHDICLEIGNQSATKDLVSLSRTNILFHGLFKQNISVRQLLEAVVYGNQDTAELILKKNPGLMTVKGYVTDYSGRVFFSVSAFEYALWALDTRYMTGMMLTCLKENQDLKREDKLSLAQKLKSQYDLMQTKGHGVSYLLKGVNHCNENHFDITPLLTAIQTYIERSAEYHTNPGLYDSIKALFIKGVGLELRHVPAHVAQHYCEPKRPFLPLPTFETKSFKRCLDVFNWINTTSQKWWGKDDLVLGVDIGICRGSGIVVNGHDAARWEAVDADRVAIKALFKRRTLDCMSIKEQLETLIQNHGLMEELPLCSVGNKK